LPTEPTNLPPRSPGSLRPRVLPLLPGLTGQPGERRPLPDAGAVRRLVIPDSGPPYDDERPAQPGHPGPDPARRYGAGSARPGQPRPSPARLGPDDRDGPHRGPVRAAGTGPAGTGPAGTGPAGTGPAGGWAGQFAQALAETLAGSRPSQQIVPWTTVQARRRIRQLGPTLSAAQRPLVRRVVTSRPADDVVEMTVVARFGTRTRALAIRLERDGPHPRGPGGETRPGRWLCTAIEAA
jgi:Family of unknown function (DUF6459)